MNTDPIKDHGQQLDAPTGKAIGFFDEKSHFDQFAKAVVAANIPPSAISSLAGKDGMQLLERLKNQNFFFGDGEDDTIKLALKELDAGHVTAIVEVADRSQALQVAELASQFEGRGFTHFGTWVNEQLST